MGTQCHRMNHHPVTASTKPMPPPRTRLVPHVVAAGPGHHRDQGGVGDGLEDEVEAAEDDRQDQRAAGNKRGVGEGRSRA